MQKYSLLFFIGIIIMFILSCNVLPVATEKEDNKEKKIEEIVMAMSPARVDMDPLHAYTSSESQFYTAVYEGLVAYHPVTLAPIPALAVNWEISENGLIYTFYLREYAVYSNGDPVTADDVRNSWLRFMDPDAKAEYSVYFDIIKGVKEYRESAQRDLENIGLRVLSETKLEVELEKPASHFLKLLCHMSFMPIHTKYLDKEGWGKDQSIVSNGPFYLYNRNEKEMILKKNNLHWFSDQIDIDTVRVLFIEDENEISKMFNNYQVHWALNWETDLLDDTSMLVLNPMFATSYLFFVSHLPPWNDPRVRRGLAMLLPWDELRSEDVFFTTDTLVPKITDYPEVKGITEKNKEEGLSLLEEAGFPGGEGLPPLVIKIPDEEGSIEIAAILANAWKEECNLDVKVKAVPHTLYFEELYKEDYTIGTTTWIGDFADPIAFLQMWTSGSNLNEARYVNPAYDTLIEDSYREKGTTRYERLAKAEELLLFEAVVLPLRNYPALNLVNSNLIEGWYPNPLDIHPFHFMKFREEKIYPGIVQRNHLMRGESGILSAMKDGVS